MFDWVRLLAIVSGAIGGAAAIGGMEMFSTPTAFPLAAIPFATSIVMVLGTPDAAPAQPRALIGGHLVATLVGLAVVKLCGPAPWAAAMAVGLAMYPQDGGARKCENPAAVPLPATGRWELHAMGLGSEKALRWSGPRRTRPDGILTGRLSRPFRNFPFSRFRSGLCRVWVNNRHRLERGGNRTR
jgi:hypothetical protein